MRKFTLFFIFILMIFGCADQKVIVHEPLKNELLAYTSKSEIIDGTDRTLIVGTYLNPINASLLAESDEMLKFAGFSMPWAVYYEVIAPSKQSDDLALSFEIYQSKPVLLNFRKVAKSLYWNH